VLDWRARYLERQTRDEAEQRRLEAEHRRDEAEKRARAERRRARRFRALTIASVLFALVAIGTSIWAMGSKRKANERKDQALSGTLAANALTELPADPELSVLLAETAVKRDASPEAEEALRRSLPEVVPSRRLVGHRGQVTDGAFSPRGDVAATSSRDGHVRLWDATSGRALAESERLGAPALGLEFARNGATLLVFGEKGLTRVLDAASGETIARPTSQQSTIYDGAMNPRMDQIATGGEDGRVVVSEASTGRTLWARSSALDPIVAVDYSDDGRLLLTAGYTGAALWDAATGRRVNLLKPRATYITSAALSPDGKLVALGGDDGDVAVIDAKTRKEVTTSISPFWRDVRTVSFTADSKTIVAGGEKTAWAEDVAPDRAASSGPLDESTNVATFSGHRDWVNSAAIGRDGSLVLTASDDGTARLWDRNGAALAVLKGHQGEVLGAAFDERGGRVLTVSDDRTARIWTPARSSDEVYRGDDWQLDAQLTPDGRFLVATGSDSYGGRNTIRVWQRGSSVPRRVLTNHAGMVSSVDISPDGARMITGSDDWTVRLWRTRDWRSLWTADVGGPAVAARFSPDGKTFAVATVTRDVEVWDVRTKRRIRRLRHPDSAIDVAFTPTGRIITGGLDGAARIFDVRSGRVMATLRGHSGAVTAVAASEQRLATASTDGTARLWNARGDELIAVLRGHAGRVSDVEFSPDGRRIVTAGLDGTARIWDARTGEFLGTASQGAELVNRARFTPDGKQVITASDDNAVHIGACETCAAGGSLLRLADQRVPRELTTAERKAYVEDGS
jgi:WD40 repeat protein